MITCTFEDKGTGLLRHVTTNAIVVRDGQVLLAKRGTYHGGKPLLEAGKWALIGGFLSRDESIEEALRREVMEESGWIIENLRLFHIKDNPDRTGEDRQNIEFVYIADVVKQTGTYDEEVSALTWFPLDALPDRDMMAFDHGDDLQQFIAFNQSPFPLPFMGKRSS